ncbi:MAG: hypothetical protein KJ607_13125, partial [Bacteroidetes bacterium]|nr:hypothetical protein [Bacteroidota bacterium]
MKTTVLLLSGIIILLLVNSISAQTPHAFKYQAITRDDSGVLLENQPVSFRMSILQSSPSGTIVYQEEHSVTTNEFGLVILNVGEGAVVSGIFADINWGADLYFLQVE